MISGGKQGESTQTGLNFEKKVDLQSQLSNINGYHLAKIPGQAGVGVYFEGELVARCFRKNDFYRFLEENNIDWKSIISRKLLPDDAMLVDNSRNFIYNRSKISASCRFC